MGGPGCSSGFSSPSGSGLTAGPVLLVNLFPLTSLVLVLVWRGLAVAVLVQVLPFEAVLVKTASAGT